MSAKEPVDYVNLYIGAIGHLLTATAPVVSLPHGMAKAAPVATPGIADSYLADKIFGFPAGFAIIMPGIGSPQPDPGTAASGFDHDLETATPYWYSVFLEDSGIQAEYTVTQRTIYYRFTFPEGQEPFLTVRMPAEGRSASTAKATNRLFTSRICTITPEPHGKRSAK